MIGVEMNGQTENKDNDDIENQESRITQCTRCVELQYRICILTIVIVMGLCQIIASAIQHFLDEEEEIGSAVQNFKNSLNYTLHSLQGAKEYII